MKYFFFYFLVFFKASADGTKACKITQHERVNYLLINKLGLNARKPVLGFLSRSISNQPAQQQRLARIMEFGIKQVQISYFGGSE